MIYDKKAVDNVIFLVKVFHDKPMICLIFYDRSMAFQWPKI